MVEKLISKLIEEAKGKAEEIFEKGKKEFEEKFKIEKEKLDIEFEEKLKLEKKKIDSEIERGIINFKIEKEKEILAIKNKIIDEVIEKVLSNLNEKDVEIFVPEGQKINLKYKVVNDKNLKNSFRIKSKLWEIEFSWDSIKTIFEGFIKEEASKIIFNE